MTIIDFKDLKCAVCEHKFSGQILRSTYSTGGSDLDLCSSRLGLQTLGLEVSVCPNCHYVSHYIEKPVSNETRIFVLSNPAFKENSWHYTRVMNYQNLMRVLHPSKNDIMMPSSPLSKHHGQKKQQAVLESYWEASVLAMRRWNSLKGMRMN